MSAELRFDGSLWCNLDIALRSIDQVFKRGIQPAGLSVIEWYILRALYVRDGQHASELARAVGRAATSFTPNLDKLQKKGYVERRADPADRRAVRIHLTPKAVECRDMVLDSAKKIDREMREIFSDGDRKVFTKALLELQALSPD
jgi:MarR family transcriptional regulator, organic hydroperoxide resistance regulator